MEDMVRFLQIAFPEFRIRHEGTDEMGVHWMHVGNDQIYLALNQATATPQQDWVPYQGLPGVNHLGFEVDDVEALHARLLSGGYKDNTVPNNHAYRKRIYFFDPEGNDWEFVQYFSEDPAKRNDYDLPDI
jgi:catechol 2,3-dioxygenase-like lactoylglutathione lyase family enzyme